MESDTQYMTPDMKRRYTALEKDRNDIMLKIAKGLSDLRNAHADINAMKAYGRISKVAFERNPALAESHELSLEYLTAELERKGQAVTELYRQYDEIEERKLDIVLESLDARR